MTEAYINSLLRDIPSNVDYTELPEDIDLEDLPLERIEKDKTLLVHEDNYIVFQAARLLTSWGVEKGFHTLEKLLVDIFSEKLIKAMFSESEYPAIYETAFNSYVVDESQMFRYAKRRKSADKIKKFIQEETDAKLRLE